MRLTFGIDELVKGVSFVVAVMGLFGIGEMLVAVEEEMHAQGRLARRSTGARCWRTVAGLPRYWVALMRSAAIGCWMGITPGGPTAASFMSYGIARRFSRAARELRKGRDRRHRRARSGRPRRGHQRAAPDAGARHSGLGDRGGDDGRADDLGLNPGPVLFVEQKDFVWGLIASMYVGNIVAVVLVLATVPIFAALMRVPFFIIAPLIFIVCVVGAYSVSNSYLDVHAHDGLRRARATCSRSSTIRWRRSCWRS